MTRPLQPHRYSRIMFRGTIVLLAALTAGIISAPVVQAQTYQVIHRFQGGEGAGPKAGLTIDAAGRLYGTTEAGGAFNFGTVFKLVRSGSGWTLTTLYSFKGDADGRGPAARVIFGPDGDLYGTTYEGGGNDCDGNGCGTVFKLKPRPSACNNVICPWNETVIYAFGTSNDGSVPLGDLLFDDAGNIYGVTSQGGPNFGGTVYELTPSGAGWTESTLYSFGGRLLYPTAGVIFDKTGNLYATLGGYGYGNVFQLTPSGGVWSENTLYAFQGGNDGGYPYGLVFDHAGNLYGATDFYGGGGDGTVFELAPSNGGWTFSLLFTFIAGGGGPVAPLTMDKGGNLYGTTRADGAYNKGSIFKLTPGASGWSYTSLHDFTGTNGDGAYPESNVVFDANGNLYGTASIGGNGQCQCGLVWEVTP